MGRRISTALSSQGAAARHRCGSQIFGGNADRSAQFPLTAQTMTPSLRAQATRQRILDAAQRLIEKSGFIRLTTKEIAREAGVAEGTIFKHFRRKDDLCVAVVLENSPRFQATITRQRAGQGSVQKNLEEIALAAI